MSESQTRPSIQFWNSRQGRIEKEEIFGEGPLRWLYETAAGRALSDTLLSRPWFSRLYGGFQDTRLSARKIDAFIRNYRIPVEEYEPGPWKTFNDFFIRRFREGARPFPEAPGTLGAFAEARYLAFERLDPRHRFPVKGIALTAAELLGSEEKAAPFAGGPAWIARLCPVDYHRYHYPDEGRTLESYPMHGQLHSVSPIALRKRPEILITNERRVALLETRNFGKLAFVEIGAMSVGKIEQSWPENRAFGRGDEKGYFLFGGSSAVLLAEPGPWKLDHGLLERSRSGLETWIPLGQPIGARAPGQG